MPEVVRAASLEVLVLVHEAIAAAVVVTVLHLEGVSFWWVWSDRRRSAFWPRGPSEMVMSTEK